VCMSASAGGPWVGMEAVVATWLGLVALHAAWNGGPLCSACWPRMGMLMNSD